MAKKSITIDCSSCLNSCTVQGTHADTVQFCPFCGESILMSYDDMTDTTFDEDDDSDGEDALDLDE